MGFEVVKEFEEKVAEFFGAPYSVAVDSCTHGLELCLRLTEAETIFVPNRTYISIPFLAEKLGIKRMWRTGWSASNDIPLPEKYGLCSKVWDAATMWRKDSYIQTDHNYNIVAGDMMCISFQYQKHLSLGRGGMILLDNEEDAIKLKKMSYDGRLPDIPWREQDIDSIGYHYYMTPETAQQGLDKLEEAINTEPRKWVKEDWPELTKMKVFQK